MRLAASKLAAGLVLLSLLSAAVWVGYTRSGRNSSATLDKMVSELRGERPWYYRFMKRTHTLQLVPKKWLHKVGQSDLAILLRRGAAVSKLSRRGTNAWPAMPALLATLRHGDYSVEVAAAEVLAGIKAEQHPEWDRWEKLLSGQSRAARAFHHLAVGRNNSGKPDNLAHRRFGLIGLAATGPAAATACTDVIEIIKFNQEELELRALAVLALGRMQTSKKQLVPLLKGLLQDEEEWPSISAAAVQALAAAVPDEAETRPLLRRALQDQRSLVRLTAARALWRLKAPAEEVLPVLTALLNHKLVTIRTGALNGLAEMESTARPSRSEVERLTSDADESVRRCAVTALSCITGHADAHPDGQAVDPAPDGSPPFRSE
jgi:HEAT repeat protein